LPGAAVLVLGDGEKATYPAKHLLPAKGDENTSTVAMLVATKIGGLLSSLSGSRQIAMSGAFIEPFLLRELR
jgi:hypothetical protein